MPTLEPTVALETCENALRQLMAHAYKAEWGGGWLERVSNEDQRNQWAERGKTESTRRKGVTSVPQVGLAYAQFYELLVIADKHWSPLAAALGKKASTYPLLQRFENLRDTVAHHRPLVPFEQELYSGIAGQIRNQVTIYMSTQDPGGEFYPRLESVTDSFGNSHVGAGPVPQITPTITPPQILHPGDVVTFTAIGTDAQSRDLEYIVVQASTGKIVAREESSGGNPVALQWVVTDDDVAERAWVNIYMRAKDVVYHRFNPRGEKFDDQAAFGYRVNPPA
jgi:hypothetical protein